MKLKVFTVYDSKAEAYLPPVCYQSKGQAIRSFSEAANDEKSTIGKYPEDFIMFELGEYDDSSSKIVQYDAPISVGIAVEFVKS